MVPDPVKAVPWVLVVALLAWAVIQGRGRAEDVDRARAYEAAVATLRPLADSLRLEAERRDTVLIARTDTINQVIIRTRESATVIVDTLYAMADSVETAFLDSLITTHATEVAALTTLAEERLLWGQGWKDAYTALDATYRATEAARAAWESAYRGRESMGWLERGAFVVSVGCLLLC